MRHSLLFALALWLSAGWMQAQDAPARGTSIGPPIGVSVAVIPVAISAPGRGGAAYHTAVQAYNPGDVVSTGVFLFRAEGSVDSESAPILAYSINPGQTLSFVDLLSAMGQQGIGSIDVVASNGTGAPILSVRVYDDAAGSGTVGFTESVQSPGEALASGSSAVLVAPQDMAAFRFDVGVRTLGNGASITATLRDSAGNVLGVVQRTYPANFFEQTDATSFLQGLALGANDTISIDVVSGSLFVYGATADAYTGDPSIAPAQRVL